MKKLLKKIKIEKLYYYKSDRKVLGSNTVLNGDCSGLKGDCSGLVGDCSGLEGDCTGLRGDCSGLVGDIDSCEISDLDRNKGIDIADLVK